MNSPVVLNSLQASESHSAGNLIAIAFPKSPSRAYSETVALAQRANAYGEFYLGDKLFHSAVFGLDKAQASYALMVIEAAKDWKGTKLFAQGRILVNHYNVFQVLRCYLDSLTPQDHRAHCHYVYDYLGNFRFGQRTAPEDRHLIPCRMLQGFTQHTVVDNVSTPEDAITALAIRRGSFWYPHFDASAYKKSVGYSEQKETRSVDPRSGLLSFLKRFWK